MDYFSSSSLLASSSFEPPGFDIFYLEVIIVVMIVLRKGRISSGMCMLSYKKQSLNILKSMFHLKGFTHFQKSKAMQRKLSVNMIEVDQVQLALTKMREKILEGNHIVP